MDNTVKWTHSGLLYVLNYFQVGGLKTLALEPYKVRKGSFWMAKCLFLKTHCDGDCVFLFTCFWGILLMMEDKNIQLNQNNLQLLHTVLEQTYNGKHNRKAQ